MKTNIALWWLLVVFFFFIATVYTVWNIIAAPDVPWYDAIEWTGTVALYFAAFMALIIAFYAQQVRKAQHGELPEDVETANIDDGDPEIGEFSPWSWWPIVLAGSGAIGILGLAVGVWMLPIGLAIFVVAIVGWVYEYYRGYHAR